MSTVASGRVRACARAGPPQLLDAGADERSLRRFLHGLPGVDPVGVEQRAAGLATRSIKKAVEAAGHRPGHLGWST